MDYENKPHDYYSNQREEMLSFLPKTATKILDVGCGDGAFASIVKKLNNAEVWGIEYMDAEAKTAKSLLDKVFSGPCEDFVDDLPENYFDVVFFNDVLEHLVDPYMVLEKMKSKLSDSGIVISSIPSIRYHNVLIPLLLKRRFEYESFGVMDKTHMRFFTGRSIRNMYENLGYEVIKHHGINGSKSIKPFLYNIPLLFTAMDIRYPQYATVAGLKK